MSGLDQVARLHVAGLKKSFSGTQVLHDVNCEAFAGEVLGLVGENGSGKSTTMNIVAGIIAPDSGTILLDGVPYLPADRHASETTGVSFIQQELNVFPNLSVAENLFLGRYPRLVNGLPFVSRRRMHEQASEVLQQVALSIDPATLAERLSPGERQLLEIARGLSIDARLMILDEPTTSLTQPEIERLFGIVDRLRSRGVAIVFISHALEDVLRLSDRLVVMRDGRTTLTARRGEVDASGLVTAMVGRAIESLYPTRKAQPRRSKPVLKVESVAEPGVNTDISFEIGAGEIMGIAGLMGSGRTELARILFGLDPHSTGRVYANGHLLPSASVAATIEAGFAFVTEDRRYEGLMLDASVLENISLAVLPKFTGPFAGLIREDALTQAASAIVRQLGIKCSSLDGLPVRALSGGNQQKIVLGRWLLRTTSLLILDEPTRGVDVGAKQEIYQLLASLADEGMAICVISSELDELMGLCDRIVVMRRGRLRGEFLRSQFSQEAILRVAFGQEQCV